MDRRKSRKLVEEREEDLVQTVKAHPGLELDFGRSEDPGVRVCSGVRGGIQEPGLSDPRLAGHDEGAAIGPSRCQEGAEAVHFLVAPQESTGWATVAWPFHVLWDWGFDHRRLA